MCVRMYRSISFSSVFFLFLFFIFLYFPLCFRSWTRNAVISSENAASGVNPGTEAKVSGITEKAPGLPRAVLDFLLARSTDQ